ncbi:MAG: metal-dependent hydrolase [Thermoplasmata archaeon]|nr:metal-dependent hydrolase [Thermoplasmata archaeon]
MDLFTHVIFAYLLSFVLWGPAAPQYIAAGALAGGLPDADALLFPLWRRFPILRHHGITHSLLGVTIVAAAGSVLVPYLPFFPHASTLLYFVAMEIGGLSHVFLDGFTHFAVTPFLPFSLRQLRLDADVAINVAMLTLTSVTLVTLILERGTVPFTLWIETAWLLTAIYAAYLLVRGIARWKAEGIRRREGYTSVAPTTNPRVWTLLEERDSADRYRVRYRRYRFGERTPQPERTMEVRKVAPAPGPVLTPEAALERTYLPALDTNRWLASRAHAGHAVARETVFEVAWFIVEMSGAGRTMGVRGEIDRSTGAMRLRSGLFQVPASEAN